MRPDRLSEFLVSKYFPTRQSFFFVLGRQWNFLYQNNDSRISFLQFPNE